MNHKWEGMCGPCPHLTQASKVRLGQVLHLRVMNGFGGWALFMTRVTSKQAFCTRQRAVGALLWPSCPQREGLELLIGQEWRNLPEVPGLCDSHGFPTVSVANWGDVRVLGG